MDESSRHLQQQIESAHNELDQNLQALETKARELTDWRAQFEKRPLVMLGLAFGGGLIAASLLGGGGGSSRPEEYVPTAAPSWGGSMSAASYAPPREAPSRGSESWRQMREALGVVATGAAMDMLHQALPTLKPHLERARDHLAKIRTEAEHSTMRAAHHTAPLTSEFGGARNN